MPVQETLFCLGCSGQPSTKYFFPQRTLFKFMCPYRPASWAGSHAGPPVSECVSPWVNLPKVTPPRSRYLKYVLLYCEKGNPAIHSLTEMFCNISRRIGVLAFCMPGNGGFAKFSFPTMINLLQGNKNRQRYHVYPPIEKPCERTI